MSDSGWSNQVVQAFLVEIITGVPGSGLFVYNGTPAFGNPPITSITGGTVDPEGNVVKPTIEVQGTGAIWVVGSAGQAVQLSATAFGGEPSIAFLTGVSEEHQPANIQGIIVSPGAVNERPSVDFVSANVTGFADRAIVNLNSSAKDGSTNAFGALQYQTTGGIVEQFMNWGINGLFVQSTFAGDNNNYDVGDARLVRTSNLLINTTLPGQQVFNGVSIGVGTYQIDGWLHLSLAAAGQPLFQFGGLTAVATMLIEFVEINEGAPGSIGFVGTQAAFASPFTGQTMGGGGRTLQFRGNMQVTTAGLLGLFAATSNVADTYTINFEGSYMNVSPIY